MRKRIIIGVIIFVLAYLFIRSVYSTPQVNTEATPLQSLLPSPTATIQPSPSPSPKIIEFDTRDPNTAEDLDAFFKEYCKNNDCSSPKPSIVQPKSFCYVEKDGSFYMSPEECQKLHDADPGYFRGKAYENCKDGKNPEVKSDGDQRKIDCSKIFGLDY